MTSIASNGSPKILDKANIILLQNSYIHLLEGVQGCRCLWLYIGSIFVTIGNSNSKL